MGDYSERRSRDDDRGSRRSRDDDRDPPRRSSRDDEDRPVRRGREDDDAPRSRSRRDDDGDSRSSRGGSRSYEYQPRSRESADKRSSQGANDFDKILKDHIKMWKPNDGDNRIRILPPTWDKAEHFGLDIFVNYGVGPDRQSYLDLSKMKGEPDPIAEARDDAKRDLNASGGNDKELEQYVKDLTSKKRVLVYLVDREHPKDGVQAWAMPWGMDRDIVKVSVDKQTGEVLPIDHPEDGYDVEFEKKGAGMRTEYLGVAIARRSTPLGDDRWLDFAMDNPLPDQLQFYSYDHIAKAFGGGGSHKSKADRDDDRGGRDRDRDRDDRTTRGRDDDRGSRDRDRDDDRGSRRRDPEPAKDELTWESIHDMTKSELQDIIDAEKLDINPREAKDLDDLADWICDELKLEKAPARRESSSRARVEPDDDVDAKLREMRSRRRD